MALGLGEGVSTVGGQPGLDPGRQGSGGLAGCVPVGGQLGRNDRGRLFDQLWLLGQGAGIASVQFHALAG